MVKEAAAETAALGMRCDTRPRLRLAPTPRPTGGRRGSSAWEARDLPLAAPPAVHLSAAGRICSRWSTKDGLCGSKEGAKLWLVVVGRTQMDTRGILTLTTSLEVAQAYACP